MEKTTTNHASLLASSLEHGMGYPEYRGLIRNLLDQGKTTGPDQREELIHYTELNWQRMMRVEKTTSLTESVQQRFSRDLDPVVWLVLTEAWCGDAATNVPVLAAVADAHPNIRLALLLRDEHPAIMDQFLTNGGKAIPKLIALDSASGDVRYTWGPRPEPAQAMVRAWKANPNGESYHDFAGRIQLWYAKDRSRTLQEELLQLMG
jgi:hypothetical protein